MKGLQNKSKKDFYCSDKGFVNAEKLNRTIFIRDNLEVLRCLEDNCIDLIYLISNLLTLQRKTK